MQSSHISSEAQSTPNTRRLSQRQKITLVSGLVLMGVLVVFASHASHVSATSEVAWLSRLADGGDNGAQLELAFAYIDGLYGLKPDPVAGQSWLKVAAKGGNRYAQQYLTSIATHHPLNLHHQPGMLRRLWYSTEEYSPVSQTAEALQAHARQGDPVAEYQLALRYRDGAWAVKQNAQKSIYWLQRAAAAGNPVARKDLASLQHDKRSRGLHPMPSLQNGGHV